VNTRQPWHTLSRRLHLAALVLLAALAAESARAFDTGREDVAGFVAEMSDRHGFDAAALTDLMSKTESRSSILEAIARPAEKRLTWQEYRALFITDRRVTQGIELAGAQSAALERASAGGVPAQYLVAITGVETFYGQIAGKYRVIDALSTLGFDYPPRSRFFREQLEQFLLMAREESLDALAPLGSYAGAMGIPQFMPGSFRTFAVDGDGDGHRNLWSNWSDVFASVSNYLVKNGWRPGEPVMVRADVTEARLEGLSDDKLALSETVRSLRARGVQFETSQPPEAPAVLIPLPVADGMEYRVGFSNYYAITRYNRSSLYASAVNDLAEAIAAGAAVPAEPVEPVEPVDADGPADAAPRPASTSSFDSISSTPK